jgi:hypothetical protein
MTKTPQVTNFPPELPAFALLTSWSYYLLGDALPFFSRLNSHSAMQNLGEASSQNLVTAHRNVADNLESESLPARTTIFASLFPSRGAPSLPTTATQP